MVVTSRQQPSYPIMLPTLYPEEPKKYDSQYQSFEVLEKKFSEFVDRILATGNREEGAGRVLIFIDNLDRCMPENALELLEKLRVFLRVKGCLFVIAYDGRIITDALRNKYGPHSHINSDNYLEKIVDLEVELPTNVASGDIVAMLVEKWAEYAGKENAEVMRGALSHLSKNTGLAKISIARNPRKWFKTIKKLATRLHFNSKASMDLLSPMLVLLLIKDYSPQFFNCIVLDGEIVRHMALWNSRGHALVIRGRNQGSLYSKEHKETFAHRFGTSDYLEDEDLRRLCWLVVDAYNSNDVFFRFHPENFHEAVSQLVCVVEGV